MRATGEDDKQEVQARRHHLQHRQRDELEQLARFLAEPLALPLEGGDGTLPVVGHRRGTAVGRHSLDHHGLAAEQRDQCRRAKPAEQEPGHAAHTHPAEEGETDGTEDAELDSLLREPRRHGVDELTIEEQHLEHRDRDLNENHEDDIADRKSTRLNSSHLVISYAVFCLKKKKKKQNIHEYNHNTTKTYV